VLTIVIYLGLYNDAASYLDKINYYLKIYVCLFLIWRFNPFVKTEFTELDRKITFSAGLLILTTTVINQFIVSIISKAKNIFEGSYKLDLN